MSEKTEQPTPKKLRDARRKGNIAFSRDFNGIVTYIVGLALVFVAAGSIARGFRDFYVEVIEVITIGNFEDGAWVEMTGRALSTVFAMSAPFMLAVALVGGVVGFLQAGPLFTTEPLVPKPEKLNPLNKLKQWFALKGLFELAKSALKLGLIFWIGWLVLRGSSGQLLQLGLLGERELLIFLAAHVKLFLAIIGFAFLILGVVDVLFQRWQWRRGLRMSKDDIKREWKSAEGDPLIKSQRKALHRSMSAGGGAAGATKKAAAVVVNPTHLAIALEFDESAGQAPVVAAKGQGKLAKQILRVARRHQIPIIRNKPLAWQLLEVDVEEEIDPDLYEAVAEVILLARKLADDSEDDPEEPVHGSEAVP